MGRNTIIDGDGIGNIIIDTGTQTVNLSGTATYIRDSENKPIEGKWSLGIFTLERGSISANSFSFGGKSGNSLRITINGDSSKTITIANCSELFTTRGATVSEVSNPFLGIILPGIDCEAKQEIPQTCEGEGLNQQISLGQEIAGQCIPSIEAETKPCLEDKLEQDNALAKFIQDCLTSVIQSEGTTPSRNTDPLVLDLNGNGIAPDLVPLAQSDTYFDLDQDGLRENTGWVGPNDGMVALDTNNNGRVDNIDELFGYQKANGIVVTGTQELSAYDANNDGIIDSADPIFPDLRVWQDLNQDGETQTKLTTKIINKIDNKINQLKVA